MYYYVYDEFVQDSKFEREVSLIETRLTDLGISGKIARLALFRNAKELIKDQLNKGVKTIVAVGNDNTLRKVIDASFGNKVVVGMIPLGKEGNAIADILGVPSGVEACDILSARIVEELDIGSINGHRFLSSLFIPEIQNVVIECDKSFKIKPFLRCSIGVKNLTQPTAEVTTNPTDGKLELIIRVQKKGFFRKKKVSSSIIPVSNIKIISDDMMQVIVDGDVFEDMRFDIKVVPKALRIITGKGRRF